MKNKLLGLILLLVAFAAHARVDIQHWTAPSGARIFFVESHVLPIVDIQVDFAAGAAYQQAEKVGTAGLTRALMDSGAGNMNEEQIAEKLVDIGAHLFGSTDLDRASFGLRTLSSKSEREAAIDLMRTVLQQPTFPPDVLERERARTIASIQEADTRPDSIASKRFWAKMYGSHPYGWNPTVETVKRVTRDDLIRFYRNHYGAKTAVVSIIGDLSRAEAETIAQRLTDALPAEANDATLPAVALPAKSVERIPHPATQAHVFVGMPSVHRGDPDYIPLLVGNYILGGGGFVSRLTKEVREKRGYAYSVYSFFQPLKLDGPFQVGLQTKREQATDAIKVVEQTVQDFLQKGPTEEELRAAKKNLIDGFGLRLDSNRKILEYLSLIGFYNLPLTYLDDFPVRVGKVTVAEVRAAFGRHVRPEHLVSVIVAGDGTTAGAPAAASR